MKWRKLSLGVWISAATVAGCAHSPKQLTREVAQTGVRTGVEESLKAVDDPKNQHKIEKLAYELDEPAKHLTSTVTGAVFEQLTEEEQRKRLQLLARELSTAMTRGVVHVVQSEVVPAVGAASREQAQEMVRALFSGESREVLASFSREIARESAAGIRDSLVPHIDTKEKNAAARALKWGLIPAGLLSLLFVGAGIVLLAALAYSLVVLRRELSRSRQERAEVRLSLDRLLRSLEETR